MAEAERLKTELDTYHREKLRLVAEHEGKYVVIDGTAVDSVWDTYEDALKAGYGRFGLEAFLVKQIQRVDQVHFFTRDLAPCPS